MIWHGTRLDTIGDLLDAACTVRTRDEGQEFMRLYRAECKYADENIGYLSGYCDRKTMARIQDLCGVSHPIFGRSTPTPEEAFEAGVRMAQAAKATE